MANMKVSDLEKIEGLTIVQADYDDCQLVGGYASDLLSDVMANAGDAGVLITIQAHKNTIAVCKLLDITALVICNGREIDEEFLKIAKTERKAVFATELNQFQVSVIIGKAL